METTRLSSKGQVILPKFVRDSHHWLPGTEFTIVDTPEGVLLQPTKSFQPTRLEEVIGCTGYQGPAKTLQDMEDAIEKGVKARHARG